MAKTEKEIIKVENAPAAIGPYSMAVKAGEFVFTSGQLGLDPVLGTIVTGGIEAETRQALRNLKTILEGAGSGIDRVVKTTVFLRDIGDFAKMNAVYAEYFTADCPARSAIQVAALPKNGMVEIEAVALWSKD